MRPVPGRLPPTETGRYSDAMRENAGQRLVVGAMSGTSADGVDAAVVEITGRGLDMKPRLLAHRHVPYDPDLRRRIFAARTADGSVKLADLAQCCRAVTLASAAAVREALGAAGVESGDLSAVAAHGQTLYHAPPDTMQVLDPALLAAETHCAVVSDFRRADCAAGGQGAPLVPFADYVLFRDPRKTRVLLNIGGIANVTYLRAGGSLDDVVAFDTGPGNCVSDWLCRTLDPVGPGYDVGGERAMRGKAWEDVSHRIDSTYFNRRPPKSTDVPEMISIFREAIGDPRAVALDDLLATACRLTVEEALGQTFAFVDAEVDEVIVAGGGTRNARMMKELKRWTADASADIDVLTSDSLGVPSESREAVAFAVLGAATLDGLPSNVPSATGARRRVVLGSVTSRP